MPSASPSPRGKQPLRRMEWRYRGGNREHSYDKKCEIFEVSKRME
jgi:hypothetical protein